MECVNRRRCYDLHLHDDGAKPLDIGDSVIPWESLLPFNMEVVKKEHHSCRLHRDGLCKFPSQDCMDINGYMFKTDRKLTTSDVRLVKWLTGYTVDADFIESPYISKDWKREQ